MRVRKVVRNIGMWGAGVAIAAVLGVACAQPASAEEGTGNMVFFSRLARNRRPEDIRRSSPRPELMSRALRKAATPVGPCGTDRHGSVVLFRLQPKSRL